MGAGTAPAAMGAGTAPAAMGAGTAPGAWHTHLPCIRHSCSCHQVHTQLPGCSRSRSCPLWHNRLSRGICRKQYILESCHPGRSIVHLCTTRLRTGCQPCNLHIHSASASPTLHCNPAQRNQPTGCRNPCTNTGQNTEAHHMAGHTAN